MLHLNYHHILLNFNEKPWWQDCGFHNRVIITFSNCYFNKNLIMFCCCFCRSIKMFSSFFKGFIIIFSCTSTDVSTYSIVTSREVSECSIVASLEVLKCWFVWRIHHPEYDTTIIFSCHNAVVTQGFSKSLTTTSPHGPV